MQSALSSGFLLSLLLAGCAGGSSDKPSTDQAVDTGTDLDGDTDTDTDADTDTDSDTDADTDTDSDTDADTDTDSGPVDADGDGYNTSRDCNDGDPEVHPGAQELCDEVDNDCDGSVDEGATDGNAYYTDRDHDGFGAGAPVLACSQPAGTVTNADDCDDTAATVNPDGVEVCNSVDDDCNGAIDDSASDMSSWYPDTDRDSHGDMDAPATLSCSAPSGYVASHDDCDDSVRTTYPGATETCNSVDDDCDGSIDEGATDAYVLYPDTDGDGYGDTSATPITSCSPMSGYTVTGGDCNDRSSAIHPGATELCDGVDNDCNGTVDGSSSADASTVWPDRDGDGYGDASASSSRTCTVGSGFVTNNGDCVDSNYNINPAADERCNGYDDNCDGAIDGSDSVDASYGYEDADGDSFGNPDSYGLYCDVSSNNLDCDDASASEPQVVDSASTSTSTDGSAANPWYYIQDGIDAANECVLVRAGLYGENLDFGGKDVLVFSEEGANATFIDGGHSGAVVTFSNGEGSGAELRGFTLTNGTGHAESSTSTRSCGSSVTCTDHYYTVCGGGVYLDGATPTLSELVITGNDLSVPADYVSANDYYYFYSFGGGMCVRNATVAMAHVTFSENTAEDGGAVYVESTGGVTFNQVGMIGNTSDFGGGVEVDGGSLTATNALLAWNDAATSGGGLYLVDATVSLTNVTVGECDAATSGGGIEATGASTLTMKNSIVYGANTMEGILMASTSTYSGTYSDVYGNVGGNYSGTSDPTGSRGNISSNPNFSSVTDDGNNTNDVWTLASGSACVDAGDTLGIYNDPDGTRNNMGAYGGPGGTW